MAPNGICNQRALGQTLASSVDLWSFYGEPLSAARDTSAGNFFFLLSPG